MTQDFPKKRGPWQQCSSDIVYENPWIRVNHEQVITPAGTQGIYGVVHFKGRAVGVLPVDDEKNTYLVGQTRYTLDAYSWEIPEGGAHAQESPLECAARELEEEVGLKAGRLRKLGRLHLSNSVTDESAEYFLATDLTQGRQHLDATEDIQVMKLPLKEALAMVLRGDITDAISVATLLRLAIEEPDWFL
jgi:8-oxo-dGTP pyrophosphatase MutT (NUDIX family)